MPDDTAGGRAGPVHDHQGQAFLVCLWVAAFLLVAGLELRPWIEQANWLAVLGVILLLAVPTAFCRRALIRSSQVAVRARVAGRPLMVRLEEAPQPFARIVAERALSFGIGKIRVLLIPGSWNTVDGYATGLASDPVISLSGGALGLAVGNSVHQRKFEVLVDHELAHIANGDIGRYYFARALLIVTALVTLLKTGLLFTLGGAAALANYSLLFPRALYVDGGSSIPGMLLERVPSAPALAAAVLAYSLAMYGLMLAIYVVIVRRREFWADRAAVEHAGDPAQAREALTALFASGRPSRLPPHSAFGLAIWHPHPHRRVAQLGSTRPFGQELYAGFVSLLFLACLLSLRFALSSRNSFWADLGHEPTRGAWIATGAFYLFAGFSIDSLLTPWARNGMRLPFTVALKAWVWLICAAVLISAMVVGADVWSWTTLFPAGNTLAGSPFEPFVRVEINSRLQLLAAFPASVALMATVRLLCTPFKDRGERILMSSGFSATVLLTVSLLVSPSLNDYRKAQLDAAQAQTIESLRHAMANRVGSDQTVPSHDGLSLAFTQLVARADQTPFWWPPAFFMFWQVPFQAPTADVVERRLIRARNPPPDAKSAIDDAVEEFTPPGNRSLEQKPNAAEEPGASDSFDTGVRKLQAYAPTVQMDLSRAFRSYARMDRATREDFKQSLAARRREVWQWYDRLSTEERLRLYDTLDPLLDVEVYAATFKPSSPEDNRKLVKWMAEFDTFNSRQRSEILERLFTSGQKSSAEFLEYYHRYSAADKLLIQDYLLGRKPIPKPRPDARPAPTSVPRIDPSQIYPVK